MAAFFLKNALIPEPALDGGYGYRCVDVLLSGGVIAALQPAASSPPPPGATLVDCTDKLLLPGMVNGHAHSPQHWLRGLIKPLPLELWLHASIQHAPNGAKGQAAMADPSSCPPSVFGLSALHCGLDTLLGGATCIMDHFRARNIDDVAAAVAAYKQLGLRVFLAISTSLVSPHAARFNASFASAGRHGRRRPVLQLHGGVRKRGRSQRSVARVFVRRDGPRRRVPPARRGRRPGQNGGGGGAVGGGDREVPQARGRDQHRDRTSDVLRRINAAHRRGRGAAEEARAGGAHPFAGDAGAEAAEPPVLWEEGRRRHAQGDGLYGAWADVATPADTYTDTIFFIFSQSPHYFHRICRARPWPTPCG